jgi:hypothetical protein
VAALETALALAEVDDVAVGVGEDLDLDVTSALDVALDQQRVVAEAGQRLAAGRGEAVGQGRRVADDPHSTSAATRGGLDHQRQPARVLGDEGGDLLVGQAGLLQAGKDRHAVLGGEQLGRDLVAEEARRGGRRPDEGEPRGLTGGGEVGVLGKKAVTGVDRRRAGLSGRRQHALGRKVGLSGGGGTEADRGVGGAHVRRSGIGVRVDGDRTNAQSPQRPHDAQRDLSAIGNQDRRIHSLVPSYRQVWPILTG